MNKVYTVELEVDIVAECAQEAFELAAFYLERSGKVQSVNGICEPYCVEGDDESVTFQSDLIQE